MAIIGAIVAAVGGVISGVNKGATDQYFVKEGEYAATLDYYRQKQSAQTGLFTILVVGLLITMAVVAFFLFRKK